METTNTVKNEVFILISLFLGNEGQHVSDETVLIGGSSALDSMKLVELCLELEDKAATLGFEFDWTSSVAMSKSRSMFRTAGSLSAEFLRQMEEKK
jgi:acyl carrier protein